jgi:outer membrane protein OmpA-like peptidoglycan-associated protein
LGKWDIRNDAAVELDKIVQAMKDNPTVVIELGSHTDSRGSNQANLDLSDKRAKASAEYIVSQGIDSNRIYGKGYGESRIVNRCKDGVKCREEEHAQNRRTEFKVVKF